MGSAALNQIAGLSFTLYCLTSKFQGGHIIFFQSLSLLGYCLFPLDIGAFICMLKLNVIAKMIVVFVTLSWSSWAAYPFMSSAVNPRRKALALYPVFLMYVSVGFLIVAIDWMHQSTTLLDSGILIPSFFYFFSSSFFTWLLVNFLLFFS